MSNVKIIISAHKEAKLPRHPFFLPVQAGAALRERINGLTPDDTGDNISERNDRYCELTAHYWAWKNLKNVSVIGLNHYRRYFDFENGRMPNRRFRDINDFLSRPYNFPEFDFQHYDIILTATRAYPFSMATQYQIFHIIEDWNILKQVVRELSPEYIPAFERSMERRNHSSEYNMFIMRWEDFNDYSSWLFRILFEVERRCKISPYPAQARVFGYMSERLINVYVEKRRMRVKYAPISVLIDNYRRGINPSAVKYAWRTIRDNLAYNISKL